MLRAGIILVALVALIQTAPIAQDDSSKVVVERQFTIGDPWTGIGWGNNPPAKPTNGPVIIGAPITGGMNPPPPPKQKRNNKRQDTIVIGGSQPSTTQAKIMALELEYEALLQHYGGDSSSDAVADRMSDIERELEEYGIAIVKSPDGISTTLVPGGKKAKKRQDGLLKEEDLKGLKLALQQLVQQYGPNSPHDVYIVKERIKHVLLAYGITVVEYPDDSFPPPSTTRQTTSTENYDVVALKRILQSIVDGDGEQQQQQRPSAANWLITQDMVTILASHGVTVETSPSLSTPKQQLALSDTVNTIALQTLMAMLEATYGSNPPRDIFIIEQTIATILNSKDIIVVGWKPSGDGGAMIPDPTIPGGPMKPDPTVPGGSMEPDPTVPGGPIEISDRRRRSQVRNRGPDVGSGSDVGGLVASLKELETQYGAYGSGNIPVAVFVIMQNIVTILQAEGVDVVGWPHLGLGSTIIGPSS